MKQLDAPSAPPAASRTCAGPPEPFQLTSTAPAVPERRKKESEKVRPGLILLGLGLPLAAGLIAAHRAVRAMSWQQPTALAPLDALYSLAIVLALLTLCGCLGRRLLARWRLAWHSSLEQGIFSVALGLAVVASVTFGLALGGLLYAPLLLALGSGLGVLLRAEVQALAAHVRRGAWPRLQETHGLAGLVTASGLVLAFLALLIASLPPTSYDALMYHLAVPQEFVRQHRFVTLPDLSQSAFPFTVEMLYTVCLLFGSETGAAMLHLSMAVMAALAVWSLADRWFDRRTAWIALAAFITASDVNRWAPVANIDLALTLFEFLAVYALLLWLETRERPWLVLCGLLSGIAMASKYTALGALVPLVLMLLAADGLTPRRLASHVGHAAVLVALALAVVAPWYLKNAVIYHNPLYPLLSTYQFDPLLSTGTAAALSPPRPDLRSLLLLPLHLVTQGSFIALTGRRLVDYLQLPFQVFWRGDVETVGRPSLLFIAAPLALGWRRDRTVLRLAFVAACAALTWAAGVQELRYLLPAFPLFAVLAGAALARLARLAEGLAYGRRVISTLVTLVLAASLLENGVITLAQRPLGPLVGQESRAVFLARAVPSIHYGALIYLAGHVQPGQRVLGVGEQRRYYVRVPMLFDDALAVTRHVFIDPGTPASTAAILQHAGVAYVLVSENDVAWFARFQPAEAARIQAAFAAVRDRYLTEVYQEPGATIYRFTPGKDAP